jgi:hypothetical protein
MAGAGVTRLKPLLVPFLLAVIGLTVYQARLRHQMVDFGVYRTAATRVIHAEPLYRTDDGHYQFKYLPAFAMAVAPIGMIDLETAKAAWFSVSFGLLLLFVRWAVRALPERRWSERTLILLAAILMLKFFGHELTLGQTNILLGVLLVAAILALQIDQPVTAGVLIGLAVFVKPYAVILAPWLVMTHGRRAAVALAGVMLAGLLAPAAIYGWTGNLDLLSSWYVTVTATTAPNLLNPDNISVAGMWAKWIGPGVAATGLAAVSATGLVGLAVAVWSRRGQVEAPDYLDMALLMLLIPLLSPQGWDYVLLLATPAVVCLIDRWRELGRPWRTATAVALGTMCLTIFDVMGRALYGRFMALSLVGVAAIVLAGALTRLRWLRLA